MICKIENYWPMYVLNHGYLAQRWSLLVEQNTKPPYSMPVPSQGLALKRHMSICHDLFHAQWFDVRSGRLFFWWNRWPSPSKFSFHVKHLIRTDQIVAKCICFYVFHLYRRKEKAQRLRQQMETWPVDYIILHAL